MTKLNVPEMSCNCCKSTITKIVEGVDASARISVDLESRMVSIESETSDTAMIDALKAKGYEATIV